MANRLIDELVINVRQRGAPAVERQLNRIVDTLEDSAAGAELLRNELEDLPRVLREVEQSANRATSSLRGALGSGLNNDAVEASLSEVSDALLVLISQSEETNDAIRQLSRDSVQATENLANSLGADLERVQDGLNDTAAAAGRTNEALGGVARGATAAGGAAGQAARGFANQNRQGRGAVRTLSDLVNISGPLVNVYAAVAANIFAVSEALRLLSEGASIARLEDVGASIGANVGTPIANIAADIREVSGGVLSYAESLRQASAAASFGFNSEQIAQLTTVARRASIALGQDFTDALNRAIRGVSRLEVELLDELGIATRLTTAYERYAATINVSADSLNAYQQRLALTNEIVRQSEIQLGFLDDQLGAIAWEEAATNARDAFDSVVVSIASATEGLANLINAAAAEGPAEAAEGRAQAILDQLTQAQIQGSRAGIVGAFNEFRLLEQSLQEQIRLQETLAQQFSANDPRFRESINLVQRYRQIISAISEVSETNFLGVDNVEGAAAAYAGLSGAVRGAAADFARLQSGIRGTGDNTEALADTTLSIQEAYRTLRDADPYADLAGSLQRLGFESEAELDRQVRITRQLSEATSAANSFAEVQNQIALTGQREGAFGSATQVQILERRLAVEQDLLAAQRANQVNATRLARTNSQILATTRQLEQARIAAVEAEFSDAAESRALLFRDINAGEIQTLRATIDLERGRQQRLSEIAGSQMQVEASRRRELDAEIQIRDIQNQRLRQQQNAFLSQVGQQSRVGMDGESLAQQDLSVAANNFNQALSQLTAQNPGLETMLTNLNAISVSFNNLGQTSLNATQLTTVGLNAFAGLLQQVSAGAIAEIDQQIAAERRRDGRSQESLARIRSLNERRIREQRRAAQQQILISTAVAVMNAAANPWPVPALPLMAAAALAGGLAYSQASSAASNQLASLNTGATQQRASLSVGQRQNSVDVSSQASRGELSFIRNEVGTGSVNSFTPRAAGGVGTPGLSFIAGENGPELITPMEPLQVTDAEETEELRSMSNSGTTLNLNITALDSRSIMERGEEIADSLINEFNQRGIDVDRLG